MGLSIGTMHKVLNFIWKLLSTSYLFLLDRVTVFTDPPLAIVHTILLNFVWNPLTTGCLLLRDKLITYMAIGEKPTPTIEHFSTERTVTVHTMDGGKVVAHKKEVVKNDSLVEAVHSISQHAPACSTEGGGVRAWKREYHDSSDNSNTGFSTNN